MRTFVFILLCMGNYVYAQSPVSEARLQDIAQNGYELHFQDFLAASATNIVSIERLQTSAARGWITVKNGDDWIVRFIGDCDESLCSSYDVNFRLEDNSASLTEFEVPELIPEDQHNQWKARQLALSLQTQQCSETSNTVVLENREGPQPVWEVYVLAASADQNVVVLGGHHKITVSADGTRVISDEPLTASCLQLARSPDGAELTIDNPLSQEPLETHVFASLLYRIPILVRTEAATYEVKGREIRVVDENTGSAQN